MLIVKPALLLAPTPCRTLSPPPLSLTCPATLISPLPPTLPLPSQFPNLQLRFRPNGNLQKLVLGNG